MSSKLIAVTLTHTSCMTDGRYINERDEAYFLVSDVIPMTMNTKYISVQCKL